MSKELRINRWIKAKEVRVIDEDGSQLGVMDIFSARKHAFNKDLDIVEVAPEAKPPVCKIMDYGKYCYQQAKKHTTKHKTLTVKEVKVRPQTNEHDLLFKMKNARKFLAHGDKVKITMFFRGREIVHKSLGQKVLDRITLDLADVANVEQAAKMEGNRMIVVLAPK
ncbi:MAG: translation initiation factor IF-3 [Nitrospiraceae bacterium]|nr:MAG: translation initiation factor IF-3 [Nitrospiraceae bacterium]